MVILAAHIKTGASPAAHTGAAKAAALTKQRFKKITVGGRITPGIATPTELETRIPVRWRTEILSRLPVGAELVIGRAFFRIFQRLIGFTDFLEFLLSIRLLAHIGMIFTRQLAVSPLDFILGGVLVHPHYFVIIFIFHSRSCYSNSSLLILY